MSQAALLYQTIVLALAVLMGVLGLLIVALHKANRLPAWLDWVWLRLGVIYAFLLPFFGWTLAIIRYPTYRSEDLLTVVIALALLTMAPFGLMWWRAQSRNER